MITRPRDGRGPLTLEGFLAELDAHDGPMPIDELEALMGRLRVTTDDLGDLVRFSAEGYQRNLIRRTDHYEALCLCWAPGQRSPIHDHRGSACGIHVVQGTLVEQVWEHPADGGLVEGPRLTMHAGEVCGSNDTDTHEVINEERHGTGLVTLHVYTPPMHRIHLFDRETGEATEYEYVDGHPVGTVG